MRLTTRSAVAVALGTAIAAAVTVGANASQWHIGRSTSSGHSTSSEHRVHHRGDDRQGTGVPAPKAKGQAKAKGHAAKSGDLDGDGYDDLGIGAPGGAVSGQKGAGYVAVAMGAKSGLDTGHDAGGDTSPHRARDTGRDTTRRTGRGAQLSQASPGVPGKPEGSDHFGSRAMVGDVDGDGYADLVVGAAGEDIGYVDRAGSVTVAFGSRSGLSGHAIAFHAPEPTAGGAFGDTLSLGDFNHDGRQDIAVAEDDKVDLVYGARDLRSHVTPRMRSVTPPDGGAYTWGLSSGDVNGDGYADLATVAAQDASGDGGALGLLPGSRSGLENKALGKPLALPDAGAKAVLGDINGDGKDDIVVDEGEGSDPHFRLRTYPGSAAGPETAHSVAWKGRKQSGLAHALTDINGDGCADLVVSDTSAKDAHGAQNAGSIDILDGGKNWLRDFGSQSFSLNSKGVAGSAEGGDQWSNSLAPADYDGDGLTDLALGASGKHDGDGSVSVLYADATKNGLTPKGSALFQPRELDYPYYEAAFGDALTEGPQR